METSFREQRAIPTLVLMGFLGAGKTTLLQQVVRCGDAGQVLVIQNEFAEEMGIESPQLIGSDGSVLADMYEIPNGCLCCSVRGEVAATLEAVLSRRPNEFDYVLVESSGLAEPEKVISMFWQDEELESLVYLDAVVTIVDARVLGRFERAPDSSESALMARQMAAADAIVINTKSSMESPTQECDLSHAVKTKYPLAKVICSDLKKEAPTQQLLHLGMYSTGSVPILHSQPTPPYAATCLRQQNLMDFTHHMVRLVYQIEAALGGEAGSETQKSLSVFLMKTGFRMPSNQAPPPIVPNIFDGARRLSGEQRRGLWDERQATAAFGSLLWADTESEGGSLVQQCGDIFRCKGLFCLASRRKDSESSSLALATVQGVGDTFEIVTIECTPDRFEKLVELNLVRPVESRPNCVLFESRFLFVGRKLSSWRLETFLREASCH